MHGYKIAHVVLPSGYLFHMDAIALLTTHRIHLTADYISPGMRFGSLL